MPTGICATKDSDSSKKNTDNMMAGSLHIDTVWVLSQPLTLELNFKLSLIIDSPLADDSSDIICSCMSFHEMFVYDVTFSPSGPPV